MKNLETLKKTCTYDILVQEREREDNMSFLYIKELLRLMLLCPVVVMFPLVLLHASDAALPNIGSCTYMEFYCDVLKCNTLFYQRLQKDPKGDCRLIS